MLNQYVPPPTILLVDDAPNYIQFLNEAVTGLGEVFFATDGQAALRIARLRKPDLILLNIEMPGMDDYAVCSTIKADPELASIAIIFISSHEPAQHELRSLNYGGIDFLQKPINLPIARARISAHLALQMKTRELAQARRDLNDVFTNLPVFIAHWDSGLLNRFCNDLPGHWFGVAAESMRNMNLCEVLGTQNFALIKSQLDAVLSGENRTFDASFENRHRKTIHTHITLVSRHDEPDGGFLMLLTDISDRKRAEIALFNEKERIRVTLNSIGDAVIATDVNGAVDFINPAAEALTGWQSRDAIGKPIERIMPLRDGSTGYNLQNPVRLVLREERPFGMVLNCVLIRRDGCEFDVEDSAAPIFNHQGQLSGGVIVFHDVSQAKAMALKMTHLANHDSLTNLPNRMLLQDRTSQALQKSHRNGGRVGMILLDIDHFKMINDSLGHALGDELLLQISTRIKEVMRAGDTLSRQGGDEFILLLLDIESADELCVVADRLLKIVATPLRLGDSRFDVTASIGISVYPDDCADMESLYRHADAAMYSAKQNGRNRYRFFSRDIEDTIRAHHLLEQHLRRALEEGAFEVFYQPKVDASTLAIVGAEALVRWRASDGTLIPPNDFIPLAEETGLIIPLGMLVFRKACFDAKAWQDAGHQLHIAVNISSVQFSEPTFVDMVKRVVEESQVDCTRVELEITEGVLAKNIERANETITTLKGMGLTLAIDDFGTGYSSLSYLKKFPVDVLKIDQSFVRDLLEDASDAAIVTAIIHMARSLGLGVVAEGVETFEQAVALQAQGCTIMQGFFYSKPVPHAQMAMLLVGGLAHTVGK